MGWRQRSWEELKAETRERAGRNAYPVFDIDPADADEALSNISSLDPDEWALAWSSIGDRYEEAARAANVSADAARLFRSAWSLYSLARWPVASSPQKKKAHTKAGEVFASYGRLIEPAIEPVRIPFEGSEIVAYLQKPAGIDRCPVVISIAGTDLFKDYTAIEGSSLVGYGIANIGVDMPGTGDAPVPARPGAERMYAALIDYIDGRTDLDGDRIVVRGSSWGSYWSARLAFAHPDRMRGAVVQSGPVHHYFSREWQEVAFGTREFLFDYVPSRLHMLGVATAEEAFELMPTFSLSGLVKNPTPPMLLIAGLQDSQVPYSDFKLLLENGSPKTAWVNPAGKTMGRSTSIGDAMIRDSVIIPWIRQRLQDHRSPEPAWLL